jgi:hypothetical protein
METSAKRSSISPSIDRSYRRISGGTPIISVGNIGGGAKLKSKKESAMERYEADRAVREAEEKERLERDPAYRYQKGVQTDMANAAIKALEKERGGQSRYFKSSKVFNQGTQDPSPEVLGRYLGQKQRKQESDASRQRAAQMATYRPPNYGALFG